MPHAPELRRGRRVCRGVEVHALKVGNQRPRVLRLVPIIRNFQVRTLCSHGRSSCCSQRAVVPHWRNWSQSRCSTRCTARSGTVNRAQAQTQAQVQAPANTVPNLALKQHSCRECECALVSADYPPRGERNARHSSHVWLVFDSPCFRLSLFVSLGFVLRLSRYCRHHTLWIFSRYSLDTLFSLSTRVRLLSLRRLESLLVSLLTFQETPFSAPTSH